MRCVRGLFIELGVEGSEGQSLPQLMRNHFHVLVK